MLVLKLIGFFIVTSFFASNLLCVINETSCTDWKGQKITTKPILGQGICKWAWGIGLISPQRPLWVLTTTYDGHWKEEKMDGYGTYKTVSGHFHVGSFKNDLRHGEGKFTLTDGTTFEGTWKEDCLSSVGFAKTFLKSLNHHFVYHGPFLNGSFHGSGSLQLLGNENITVTGTWALGALKKGSVLLGDKLVEIDLDETEPKISNNGNTYIYSGPGEPQFTPTREQTIQENELLPANTTRLIAEVLGLVAAAESQFSRANRLVNTQILPFETPHLSPSETQPRQKEDKSKQKSFQNSRRRKTKKSHQPEL